MLLNSLVPSLYSPAFFFRFQIKEAEEYRLGTTGKPLSQTFEEHYVYELIIISKCTTGFHKGFFSVGMGQMRDA